jgi:hypothetical protein
MACSYLARLTPVCPFRPSWEKAAPDAHGRYDKGEYETRTAWHRVFAWTNLSKFRQNIPERADDRPRRNLRYREYNENANCTTVKHRIAEIHATRMKRFSKIEAADDPTDGAGQVAQNTNADVNASGIWTGEVMTEWWPRHLLAWAGCTRRAGNVLPDMCRYDHLRILVNCMINLTSRMKYPILITCSRSRQTVSRVVGSLPAVCVVVSRPRRTLPT